MSQTSILLIGASCSGKGFVANIIKNKYPKAYYFSIGDLLRQLAIKNEFIAQSITNCVGIPDDMIIKLCQENIPRNKDLIIIDNTVRTLKQINTIKNLPNLNILYLEVSDDEAIKRAQNRDREDKSKISKRLQMFKEDTLPAVLELKKQYPNNFFTFNGEKQTTKELESLLEAIIDK